MQHRELITAGQAASLVGLTLRAVQKWRERSTPNRPQPVGRVGQIFVYDEQEVREYAEQRKKAGK